MRNLNQGWLTGMTIGARVIKTGLAVTAALWLGQAIGLGAPLIAAIAAIFTIQPSIHRSWVQVLQQLQSNVLGAAIALTAVYLLGSTPIVVGLVAIGVIMLCIKLGTEETIGLTLVTVVVIMEAHAQGWTVALDRLAAILIGIAAAFVVNVVIAPPQHRSRLTTILQQAEDHLSRLLRTLISNDLKEAVFRKEYADLKALQRKLGDAYDLFAEEQVWRKSARLERARLLVVYREMLHALDKGMDVVDIVEHDMIPSGESWRRLLNRQIEALCSHHEQLVWKWQGKIKSGSSAAAPPEAFEMLTELIYEQEADHKEIRSRLLVIASAIFAYESALSRLDKLIEQWLERKTSADRKHEHRST